MVALASSEKNEVIMNDDALKNLNFESLKPKRGPKTNKLYGHEQPRRQGPSLSADDAIKYLESKGQKISRQWLLKKTRQPYGGPEKEDGFLGWVYNSAGHGGYVPRHLVELENRLPVFYDPEELDRWVEARQEKLEQYQLEDDLSDIPVDDEKRARILKHGQEELKEHGYVTRTHLRDTLMQLYGYSDREIYKPIMKIAQEEQWAYPPHMPRKSRYRQKIK